MKRLTLCCAALCALCAILSPIALAEAPALILSDIEGLRSHQDLLDEIGNNLQYMESVGYVPRRLDYTGLLSQIAGMGDSQPGQVTRDAERVTLSGGVHYIDAEGNLENVILLNNAVLFNFGGTIRNLSARDESVYFGSSGGTALNIMVERRGVAYLQDAVGERLTASGNSEAILFDATDFPIVYALETASMAVIGNSANIARGYVGKTADLFDPNSRVASVEWEEGRGEVAAGGSRGGGAGRAKREDEVVAPYPPNIMEWVFNSKPQGGAVWDGACTCGCNCGNPCSDHRCCTKCDCVHVH